MTDIRIQRTGDHEYGVDIHQGDLKTTHRVTVPAELRDELLIQDDDNEQRLVQESFAFLLDKEPATSILRNFRLDVIGDYFPDYRDEIRARLNA